MPDNAHLTTPMTTNEWKLVKLLLQQGDERATWPSLATRPTGKRVTTIETRTAVDYLSKGGTLASDDPVFGQIADHLDAARRVIARCIAGDLSPEAIALFTPAEWDVMDAALNQQTNSPDEHEAGSPCSSAFPWCEYYAHKIRRLYPQAAAVTSEVSPAPDRSYSAGYMAGRDAVTINLIIAIVHDLQRDGMTQLRWAKEYLELRALLREVCNEFGDNDWSNTQSLVDVIRNHLVPHLEKP